MLDVDFATRLQTAMDLTGVRISTLARHLGVSYQAVRALLTGKSQAMTARNAASAADFLGVNMLWLTTGEGEMLASRGEGPMSLSPQERDVVLALRVLSPEQRAAFVDQLLTVASSNLDRLNALVDPTRGSSNVVPLKAPQP